MSCVSPCFPDSRSSGSDGTGEGGGEPGASSGAERTESSEIGDISPSSAAISRNASLYASQSARSEPFSDRAACFTISGIGGSWFEETAGNGAAEELGKRIGRGRVVCVGTASSDLVCPDNGGPT